MKSATRAIAIRIKDKEVKNKVCAVDLFCGAGGLTNGMEKAGIEVRLGVDIDPACEFPYTTNNNAKFLLKSVVDLDPQDIKKVFHKNEISLIAGCAPCQTFSTYNQKATSADDRWWLLLHGLAPGADFRHETQSYSSSFQSLTRSC